MSKGLMRMVTHLEISLEDVAYVAAAIKSFKR